MIVSFADKTSEDIFHGQDTKQSRKIPSVIWKVTVRKLDMINAAHDLKDLRIPPANRLKALTGRWAGYYSIRVNDQYRVVFKWTDGNASEVQITDYH